MPAQSCQTIGSGGWDLWAESGANRFQGGTLKGVISKLDYLKNLGISTIWLSPVFKQRTHEDSYHGCGFRTFWKSILILATSEICLIW